MGFAQDSGYTPLSIETMMLSVMTNINTQFGSSYTQETFIGTNMYKYFYAIIQRLQESEVKTSEIFSYLQQYFDIINARIQRPVVTNPGLIERLALPTDLAPDGYLASIKKPIDADAGKIYICVDTEDGVHASGNITITSYANLFSGTDDSVGVNGTTFTAQAGSATPGTATFQAATSNDATALSLATQINAHATVGLVVRARAVNAIVYIEAIHGGVAGNSVALAYTDNDTNVGATKSGTALTGGTASTTYADRKLEICGIIKDSTVAGAVTQGTETETIVLTNGQSFDFKYYLPRRIPIYLRLTSTLSENNQSVILAPDDVKTLLVANIADDYQLGKNFEPQRYFTRDDAPWAAAILLEWSYDNSTWVSTIYDSPYDDLFEISIARITYIEA